MGKNAKMIIGWLVFMGLFMGLVLIANRPTTVVGPEDNTPTHWYGTPKLDSSREPHHYDWQTRKWVYEDEMNIIDRANTIQDDKSLEYELDEYLQRKVRGYKKDNYWGQEYDLEDPD